MLHDFAREVAALRPREGLLHNVRETGCCATSVREVASQRPRERLLHNIVREVVAQRPRKRLHHKFLREAAAYARERGCCTTPAREVAAQRPRERLRHNVRERGRSTTDLREVAREQRFICHDIVLVNKSEQNKYMPVCMHVHDGHAGRDESSSSEQGRSASDSSCVVQVGLDVCKHLAAVVHRLRMPFRKQDHQGRSRHQARPE